MSEGEHIQNELDQISATVACLPRVNVFSVPNDYFAGIKNELSARIAADNFYAENAFTIPEGYFSNLAENIMKTVRSGEDEADEVLAGISRKNVFSVPQNYFDGLPQQIIAKVNNEEFISSDEELAALSPLIAGIGRKNIFSTPQGYFAQLNFVNESQEQARVIRMNPARSRAVFRYAAAAVITGLLGLSVINTVDRTGSSFVASEAPVVYQAKTITSSDVLNKANAIIKSGTLNEEMNNLSDKDIDQYLASRGQDVNAALVASSLNDDSKLPDATDYLTDENTLNNYLKDNNLSN